MLETIKVKCSQQDQFNLIGLLSDSGGVNGMGPFENKQCVTPNVKNYFTFCFHRL